MRFSEDKMETINKHSMLPVGTKRLQIYGDSIYLKDSYGNSDFVCRIEYLADLQDACKQLRETIESVADIFY